MVVSADLATIFEQPTLDASAVQAMRSASFASTETLHRFRDMTERLERETLAAGGENRDAALKLGVCFWLLGQPQRAIEWFAKGRNCKERHYYAAYCLRDLGQYEKANHEFEKAAASGWDEAQCNAERVDTLICAQEVQEAKQLLDHGGARVHGTADWQYARGRYLSLAGDPADAVRCFEEAIQLNPAHTRAMFHLAYLLDRHGNDEEAMTWYRRCLDYPPVHVNALINLSVLLEDYGRTAEAEACLKRILAAHPNHMRAQLFLQDVRASANQVIDEAWEKQNEQLTAILETPISDYELSVRARNCLKKLNINTLGDLTRITQAELLAYKNFGETSLNEIKNMLMQKGLRLGMNAESATAPIQSAARQVAAARKPAVTGSPELLNRPVSEMELSVRSRKCLQRLNILTVGELASRTEAELMAVRNFGQTSLSEIKRRLTEMGLSLRQPD